MSATHRFLCSWCGAQATSGSPRWPTCTYCSHECKPIDRQDMRDALLHPMQPVENDGDSVIRFKQNKIVRFLLDFARDRGTTLNELHLMGFSRDDWNQFSQLTGYSVSGFGDLSFANRALVAAADEAAEAISQRMGQEKTRDNTAALSTVTWTPRKGRP